MNKKKVLFTSLAALTLASLQAQTFAEEVDAGVTDGLVVETYVSDPEVDAPTMAEPVSATTESTGFLGLPASTINEISRQLSGVSETAAAEPVSATTESAGFLGLPASTINEIYRQLSGVSETAVAEPVVEANQAAPAMDVQAIANGDYSSVAGTWMNANGETKEVMTLPDYTEAAQGSLAQSGSARLEGDVAKDAYGTYVFTLPDGRPSFNEVYDRIFVPAGTAYSREFRVSSGSYTIDFTAQEDTVIDYMRGNSSMPQSADAFYKEAIFTRQIIEQPKTTTATPVNEKPVSTPTAPVTEKEVAVSPFADYVGTWQAPAGDRLTISDKGILTFAGKDYPLSLRDGKLTAGEITGRFGFSYDAVKDAIYLGINGLGFNPAGLSAEKLAEAKKWREDREYFYRVVETSPVEEVALTDEAIYADVLSQYKDFINSSIQQNPNTPELNASTEAAWGDVDSASINYAFYDNDGDGRNELLITHGYDQDMTVDVFTSIDEGGYAQGLPTDPTSLRYHVGGGRIYNIYRVNDAGLVQSIFRSETRGVNSVLMEDGTIWTTGRTGTMPTTVTKYQLDATGVYVEVATYFDEKQSGNERSGIYTNFATGEQLTLDELLAQINASKAVNLAALTWTAVADFVRPANTVTGKLTTTANPTTSEVVHVPLTVKSDASVVAPIQTPAAVKSDDQAPTPTYSRVEAAKQAEATQTGLPNTGDVTSVLGVIGASLSALGLAGIKRRQK